LLLRPHAAHAKRCSAYGQSQIYNGESISRNTTHRQSLGLHLIQTLVCAAFGLNKIWI